MNEPIPVAEARAYMIETNAEGAPRKLERTVEVALSEGFRDALELDKPVPLYAAPVRVRDPYAPASEWRVYDRPANIPEGQYAARRWVEKDMDMAPTQVFMLAPTLDELHEIMPAGLEVYPRRSDDHTGLLETWR